MIKTSKCELEYDANLEAVLEREQAISTISICGIEDDDEDDEAVEGDSDEKKVKSETKLYTEDQISKLRDVLISKRRSEYLENMEMELVGESENEGFHVFDTGFSYKVLKFIEDHVKKASRKKTHDERFDYLFAITYTIAEYDTWMNDHEGDAVDDLNHSLKKLSESWKKTVKLSNEELKIDSEFTRPGIDAFLRKFSESVANASESLKFAYKKESLSTQGRKRPSSLALSSSSDAASAGIDGDEVTSKAKKRKLSKDPKEIELATLLEKIHQTSLPPLPPLPPVADAVAGFDLDACIETFHKYSDHAVYDSCAEVRKQSVKFLALNSISKAVFLREIGNVNSKTWNSFMGFKGTGIGVMQQPGAGNSGYQKAYYFFEKMRIVQGEKKSKKRIDFEAAHPRGYSLKHDDGKRLQ